MTDRNRGAALPALDGQAHRAHRRHFAGDVEPDARTGQTVAAEDLEPDEPVRRYERDEPGDMIHISAVSIVSAITGSHKGQSNARGIGWEYVHV
ncbi:hypothetical protein CK219_26775 [Mesorhizobium sp. WSM4313]|nr:hypothetical protein CK219_26775 [Mesorhizobium sp. WSM4313]